MSKLHLDPHETMRVLERAEKADPTNPTIRAWGRAVRRAFFRMARAEHQEPDLWQHFKGAVYDRLGTATHTETGEKLVIYRSDSGALYGRPERMWLDRVSTGHGAQVTRFVRRMVD